MNSQTVAGTIFSTLESAADNLHDALRASEHFNRKVRGPVPMGEGANSPREEPSLSRLAHELLELSVQVKEEIATHHNVVGESREKDVPKPAASASRTAASAGY
jgi:hypothetical protein